MKEADDQDLWAKLGRQRRKRNKSGYRYTCYCQAFKTSLTYKSSTCSVLQMQRKDL